MIDQNIIKLCIKNKEIFKKHLKKRGGYKDYDQIAHIKTHKTGRITNDLFNGREGFYLCDDDNKIHESDLIWIPSTDDEWEIAENILKKGYKGCIGYKKDYYSLWRYALDVFYLWIRKDNSRYSTSSLHEALLNWIIELENCTCYYYNKRKQIKEKIIRLTDKE